MPSGSIRVVEVLRGLGLGGVEVSLLRRLRHAPKAVETIVVSTAPNLNALSSQVRKLAQDVIELPHSDFSLGRLPRLVESLHPTVVVSHTPRETYKLLRSHVASRLPIVPVVHHPFASEVTALRLPLAGALATVNHRASLHIAVSGSAARGEQCARARHVEVAPLGAQLSNEDFPGDPWPEGSRFKFLAIGRLRTFKNFGSLVRAVEIEAARFRSAGAHLVIVGSGPEGSGIRKQVLQANLSDLVTVIEGDSRAPALLKRADAFVVTSVAEGGPITALEAVLSGCRLVTTDVGLAQDLRARFSECVFVIDNPEPPSIARALDEQVRLGPMSLDERTSLMKKAMDLTTEVASQRFYSYVGYASVL